MGFIGFRCLCIHRRVPSNKQVLPKYLLKLAEIQKPECIVTGKNGIIKKQWPSSYHQNDIFPWFSEQILKCMIFIFYSDSNDWKSVMKNRLCDFGSIYNLVYSLQSKYMRNIIFHIFVMLSYALHFICEAEYFLALQFNHYRSYTL